MLKVECDLKDYLSCEIHFSTNKKKAWLEQPHFLEYLEKKFGNDVQQMRSTKTFGTPTFGIVCPTNDDETISAEE